jgi:hypothetical protein
MSDTVVASLISIVGILISVSVSVIITRVQYKIELEKIKRRLEQEYAKSLFDKRIETYPQLSSILGTYGKAIQYNKQNIENLAEFRNNLDAWNNQNGIFFSKATARLSARFRRYLHAILDGGAKYEIQKEDWDLISEVIERFGMSLKSEIGVASMPTVSSLEGIEQVYANLDEKTRIIEEKINM